MGVRGRGRGPTDEAGIPRGGVQPGQSPDVGTRRLLEQRLGPADRLEELDREAHQRSMGGDIGRHLDLATLDAPPEGGAQVGQLDLHPGDLVRPIWPVPPLPSQGGLGREVSGMPIAKGPRAPPRASRGRTCGWSRTCCSGSALHRGGRRPATCAPTSRAVAGSRRRRSPRRRLTSAGRSKPPANTEAVCSTSRSASSSRSTDQATVLRRVDWRSGPCSGPVSSRNRSPSRSRTSPALIAAIRAAASSMPSGRPSSVWQISTTAAAVCSSKIPKPGRAVPARSTNNLTASDVTPPSSANGATGTTASPATEQPFSRRRQDPWRIRTGKDLLDGRDGCRQDVLAVVDHDEQAPTGHRLGDDVDDSGVALGGDAESVGDGVGYGVGIADGCQLDEPHTVRELVGQVCCDGHEPAGSCPRRRHPLSVTSWCVRTSVAISGRTRSRPIKVVADLGRLPRRTPRLTSSV